MPNLKSGNWRSNRLTDNTFWDHCFGGPWDQTNGKKALIKSFEFIEDRNRNMPFPKRHKDRLHNEFFLVIIFYCWNKLFFTFSIIFFVCQIFLQWHFHYMNFWIVSDIFKKLSCLEKLKIRILSYSQPKTSIIMSTN